MNTRAARKLSIVFAVCLFSPLLCAQKPPLSIHIDTTQTFAPISPNLYGQFLEHAGSLVDESVWSEMLEDRKFFNPITATPPPDPPSPSFRRRPPLRHWLPIGGDNVVTMDTNHPFTGDHSPRVTLDPSMPHGFSQSGLSVDAGRNYTGRIVLAANGSASVSVALITRDTPSDRHTLTFRVLSPAFRTYALHFTSHVSTTKARLEITATGRGDFRVGAVSLMPADNIDGFRREVVEQLKQLHSGVYRFPGGNFVSAYEWRYGVGPIDKRPPIYDPVWHTVHANDVGTDEFLTLCRLLGVEPYITVNAGFGDAWSARALVEYTNGAVTTPMGKWRAANGHPAPYHIKFWGIGNEPWGDYQMGAMSPEQFALKHALFAKSMRQVDPSITLIAAGAMPDVMVGANQSRRIGRKFIPDYLSPADWSGYMLSHDLDTIDMLSEHYYASPTQHTDLKLQKKVPVTPPNLIEWERVAATQVRVKYEHYQQYLNLIPALRQKPVPIAIDEWAVLSGSRDAYKVVPAYAWAFHEMFRHSGLFQMACFTFATSTLSQNGSRAILNPTGLLFKLYRDHFGSIPVLVSGNSPQPKPLFPAGGDQPAVNPGSPTYPLDIVAAFTADRKALTIAVLNPSDTEQAAQLTLSGTRLASQGHLWQLAPASLDAINSADKPPEVQIEHHDLEALPETLHEKPFSVNIYIYAVQ